MPRWHIEEQRYLDAPQRSGGESMRFIFPDRWFDATLFFETENKPPWFFNALFTGDGLQAGWRERRVDWASLEPGASASTSKQRFRGWYVNVQTPYRRRPYGFDITDLTLDIVVRPHRTWYWKDVDELETAIAAGACPHEFAEAIRAAGRSAIEMLEASLGPFDPQWIDWRSPADWSIESFPDGWQTEPALIED